MPTISLKIPEDLLARVDGEAGDNRSAWIKEAIAQALDAPEIAELRTENEKLRDDLHVGRCLYVETEAERKRLEKQLRKIAKLAG